MGRMKTIYSFSTFAKEIGFESSRQKGFRKNVNHLAKIGALEIQQGGFEGDSLHHKKLIVVRDFYTVLLYLGAKNEDSEPKPQQKPKQIIQELTPFVDSPKIEKIHTVQYGQIRSHSRVLYLPLDPNIAQFHDIKEGDIIKYSLTELRRAPEEDEEEKEAE